MKPQELFLKISALSLIHKSYRSNKIGKFYLSITYTL